MKPSTLIRSFLSSIVFTEIIGGSERKGVYLHIHIERGLFCESRYRAFPRATIEYPTCTQSAVLSHMYICIPSLTYTYISATQQHFSTYNLLVCSKRVKIIIVRSNTVCYQQFYQTSYKTDNIYPILHALSIVIFFV